MLTEANTIEIKKDEITDNTIDYLQKKYPDFKFNRGLLHRDLHMLIDIFMGELKLKGGVYSYDVKGDDSYFQINRYKKSFMILRKMTKETLDVISYVSNSINQIVKDDVNFDEITGLIITNVQSGMKRNEHINFIEDYFDKGYIKTKIPQNLMPKFWDIVNSTNWIGSKLSTYKKIPDWYHENKKHYVDPTGTNRPDYERKVNAEIFTNAPNSMISLSYDLINDRQFDSLRAYRPPNVETKYVHLWNGAENSPNHIDSIDGSDVLIFCYLTEEKEWKEEWGGYINMMKEVNNEILHATTILPESGTMVIVNNASPIFKHGVRNLVNKNVNKKDKTTTAPFYLF